GDEQWLVLAGDTVNGGVFFCLADFVFLASAEFRDSDFGAELCCGCVGGQIPIEGRSEGGALGGRAPRMRGRGAGGGGLNAITEPFSQWQGGPSFLAGFARSKHPVATKGGWTGRSGRPLWRVNMLAQCL